MKLKLLFSSLLITVVSSAQITTDPVGNVGIGNPSPQAKLDVNGTLNVNGSSVLNGTTYIGGDLNASYGAFVAGASIGSYGWPLQFMNAHFASSTVTIGQNPRAGGRFGLTSTSEVNQSIWTTRANSIEFGTSNLKRVRIAPTGDVIIGDTSHSIPHPTLFVNGNIRAREMKITNLDSAYIPDYVFQPDYKLRSLKSVEEYVNANKHLPDVPSASEFQANGMDIAKTQTLLLLKVEELTLYIIKQQKEIDELKRASNK